MIVRTERGFTVIELMLFFAVSGALLVALMIGIGSTVSQQQYRESVISFSTFLQGQYSDALNTHNDKDNSWNCMGDGTVVQDNTTVYHKGTSSCVLLGKAIQIEDDSNHVQRIKTYYVVGCEPFNATCGNASPTIIGTNDITTLASYSPIKTEFNAQEESLDWDSTLVTAGASHTHLTASILILRSPSSGLLRVFTSDDASLNDLHDLSSIMTTPDAAKKLLTMCVSSNSGVTAKQSVTVDPSISSQDGITINQMDKDHCS
jgi:hypothetical protein